MLEAIFFDAGNTLIFPDLARTLQPLLDRGAMPAESVLKRAERAARRERDECAAEGKAKLGDYDYWQIYYSEILKDLGEEFARDKELKEALIRETRRSANWRRALPGTRETLLRLRSCFRLGVISNSDGYIDRVFEELGLRDCFDAFIDSGAVGFEKPDIRIFQAALGVLEVEARSSMYVGDVYSIDYLGAVAAGLHPMLLDLSGAYEGTSLNRVASLGELEARLSAELGEP